MTHSTVTQVEQLTEHIDDWRTPELLIDHAERLVRNVALAGRRSRNGYEYAPEALRQSAPLYEHKPVFLDHAATSSRPFDRSTRDLAGSIVNARYEAGRVRGDIQLLDTEAGRTLLALAEANRPAVGMSHVVLAHRRPDKSVVERIEDVVSVDAVVFPATTRTFREQTAGTIARTLQGSFEAILEEIDAGLAEHVARLAEVSPECVHRAGVFPESVLVEVRTAPDAPLQAYALGWRFEEHRVRLEETLEAISEEQLADPIWLAERSAPWSRERQAAENQREIERLIAESRLPEYALTPLFRQQLAAAATTESRRALLAERQTLLRQLTVYGPSSRERIDQRRGKADDAAVVAAIRGRRGSVLAGVG